MNEPITNPPAIEQPVSALQQNINAYFSKLKQAERDLKYAQQEFTEMLCEDADFRKAFDESVLIRKSMKEKKSVLLEQHSGLQKKAEQMKDLKEKIADIKNMFIPIHVEAIRKNEQLSLFDDFENKVYLVQPAIYFRPAFRTSKKKTVIERIADDIKAENDRNEILKND